jgi:hypothetical protein
MESQQADTGQDRALALAALDERTRQMRAVYVQGLTLEQVGEQFGLTRERVRQIFREAGLSTRSTRETRALRAKQILEGRGEEIKAAFRISYDIEAVARRFGLPISIAWEYIKAQFPHSWERRRPRPFQPKYPTEELIELLQSAADAVGGDLREESYCRYAAGRSTADGRPWPSSATISARFGSWSRALVAAGMEPLGRLRKQHRRKFSDEDCLAAIRAAAEALGELPTMAAYRDFARASAGSYPSQVTLRLRLGPWHEALSRAGLLSLPVGAASSEKVQVALTSEQLEEAAGAFNGAAQ